VEHLPVGGIFQQQSLESENFAYCGLGGWRKDVHLKFVHFVVANDLFQNGVEFVENLDPSIQIGAGPFPRLYLGQNL
jgi:hypothetical protein